MLKNCISIVADHYQVDRREENKKAITSMAADLGKLIRSNFVYTEWKNVYGEVTKTNKKETEDMFDELLSAFRATMDQIKLVDDQPYLHTVAISLYKMVCGAGFVVLKVMAELWMEVEEIELKNIRKRILAAYWEKHADERKTLDEERKFAIGVISARESDIEKLSETKDLKDLNEKISLLMKEQDALGFFKGKEKKALQEQIDMLSKKVPKATEEQMKASKPLKDEINKQQAHIKEIDAKLANDNNILDLDDNVKGSSTCYIYNEAILTVQAVRIDDFLKESKYTEAINVVCELGRIGLPEAKKFIDNQ